ncbi:hypothetical protein K7X08_001924 [Anisodus acutangulus]|uniref:Uncharacterized protein n=1 Tax=Anisodus acutangulus TaxID=402998 RepID=A0A9Q1LN95_9SOLA|nr:hypothetical protein K7X08_001924 [Anisodus acutangulus]
MVRVWNTKNHNIARIFRYAKGPVNNIVVIKQPSLLSTRGSVTAQVPSVKRHGSFRDKGLLLLLKWRLKG